MVALAISEAASVYRGDYFRVWHRYFSHNGIQVKLTRATIDKMTQHFHNYEDDTYYAYFLRYFRDKIKKWDQTGFNSISEADYKDAARVIQYGSEYFEKKVKEMQKDSSKKAIYILAWRSYRWRDLDPARTISFRNEFGDDHECCERIFRN
jgi:hypothetical protein